MGCSCLFFFASFNLLNQEKTWERDWAILAVKPTEKLFAEALYFYNLPRPSRTYGYGIGNTKGWLKEISSNPLYKRASQEESPDEFQFTIDEYGLDFLPLLGDPGPGSTGALTPNLCLWCERGGCCTVPLSEFPVTCGFTLITYDE